MPALRVRKEWHFALCNCELPNASSANRFRVKANRPIVNYIIDVVMVACRVIDRGGFRSEIVVGIGNKTRRSRETSGEKRARVCRPAAAAAAGGHMNGRRGREGMARSNLLEVRAFCNCDL